MKIFVRIRIRIQIRTKMSQIRNSATGHSKTRDGVAREHGMAQDDGTGHGMACQSVARDDAAWHGIAWYLPWYA